LEIDNNRSERSIKPFVIGCKNVLFANTPRGAKASATSYSIMERAKENGLNQFPDYLLRCCLIFPMFTLPKRKTRFCHGRIHCRLLAACSSHNTSLSQPTSDSEVWAIAALYPNSQVDAFSCLLFADSKINKTIHDAHTSSIGDCVPRCVHAA
jgi:hypothetical protein